MSEEEWETLKDEPKLDDEPDGPPEAPPIHDSLFRDTAEHDVRDDAKRDYGFDPPDPPDPPTWDEL